MGPFMMRFQIRDLEEFSGIKAHTIRMWEKRYNLFSPDRTGTNIRNYDLDDLKALLNVAYLNRNGFKISKIAAMDNVARDQLVREVAVTKNDGGDILDSLQMAMLSFDEALFDNVTTKYRLAHGFSALVEQVFVPLLERIGVLWQTNAICPAHEHFLSNLIRQKLIAATDGLTLPLRDTETAHVLFLPENEIHELGLLYVNYLLRSQGKHTVYLGQSVPREDLKQVAGLFSQRIVFITILMATPQAPELPAYLRALREDLPAERISFWLTGQQLKKLDGHAPPKGMQLYGSMAELLTGIRS